MNDLKNLKFLQYVAGFFDAEGSITIAKFATATNIRYQLHVSLTNQDAILLDRIKRCFSGYGSIRLKTNSESVYEMTFMANQALKFLEGIVPYLILKNQEAIEAIKFQRSLSRTGGKFLSPKVLNRRDGIKTRISEMHKRLNTSFDDLSIRATSPYLGGLIDGDGYIGILHANTLTVTIASKHYEFLNAIKQKLNIGFISKGQKCCYWIISSSNAKSLLMAEIPFLIIKKQQAKFAIEFQNLINPNNTKRLPKESLARRESLALMIKNNHSKKGVQK